MKGRMKNEQHHNGQNHYAWGGAVNATKRDVGVTARQQNAGGESVLKEAKGKTTGLASQGVDGVGVAKRLDRPGRKCGGKVMKRAEGGSTYTARKAAGDAGAAAGVGYAAKKLLSDPAKQISKYGLSYAAKNPKRALIGLGLAGAAALAGRMGGKSEGDTSKDSDSERKHGGTVKRADGGSVMPTAGRAADERAAQWIENKGESMGKFGRTLESVGKNMKGAQKVKDALGREK